jgi:hypothetical protein
MVKTLVLTSVLLFTLAVLVSLGGLLWYSIQPQPTPKQEEMRERFLNMSRWSPIALLIVGVGGWIATTLASGT